jgi:hypothetical protein
VTIEEEWTNLETILKTAAEENIWKSYKGLVELMV